MIERGSGASFALESLDTIAIPSQIRAQRLQCDTTLQLGILGEVHLSHPAFAEEFEELVVAEYRADHGLRHLRVAYRTRVHRLGVEHFFFDEQTGNDRADRVRNAEQTDSETDRVLRCGHANQHR